MRKISVIDYPKKNLEPYDVKGTLIICLLHPSLKLGARELIARNKIGDKIEMAEEFVLLEEAEYEKLNSAFETIQGFSQDDVEIVTRVFDAEQIEVEPKV